MLGRREGKELKRQIIFVGDKDFYTFKKGCDGMRVGHKKRGSMKERSLRIIQVLVCITDVDVYSRCTLPYYRRTQL